MTIVRNFAQFADNVNSDGVLNTSFRNLLHNGNFIINQRDTASIAGVAGTTSMAADRWKFNVPAAGTLPTTMPSLSNVADVPAGVSLSSNPVLAMSPKITIGSAWTPSVYQSITGLSQVLEYESIARLAWGTASASPATLSFWVKSSLTGQLGGMIGNQHGGNWWHSFLYTVNAANTWEYKTVYIAPALAATGSWAPALLGNHNLFYSASGLVSFVLTSGYKSTPGTWANVSSPPASGATGMVDFNNTAGATFQVYNVQLEKGSAATPFEDRPFETELRICQRFLPAFIASYPTVSTPGSNSSLIGTTMNQSSTYFLIRIPFKVETRVPVTGIEWKSTQGLEIISAGGTPWLTANVSPTLISLYSGGGTLGARLLATNTTSGTTSSTSGTSGSVYLSTANFQYTNRLLFTGAEI